MIQTNELRIGNYVFDLFRHTCEVTSIHALAIETYDHILKDWITIVDDKIYPIPLTEDLLVQLGFPNEYATMYETSDGWFLHIDDASHQTAIAIPVKYLHELQNAYFVATKKELDVKL